jgi:hypothetical protein
MSKVSIYALEIFEIIFICSYGKTWLELCELWIIRTVLECVSRLECDRTVYVPTANARNFGRVIFVLCLRRIRLEWEHFTSESKFFSDGPRNQITGFSKTPPLILTKFQ